MNTTTTPASVVEARAVKPAPRAPKAAAYTAPDVKAPPVAVSPEMLAELARLREENAALKTHAAHAARVSFKVSEKGGLSVYGLGRFPVTLYKEQWTRLLGQVDELRAFLAAHDGQLKAKGE